jgi:hypothetical protein
MESQGKRIPGKGRTNVAKAKLFFQWSALFCLALVALFFATHIVRAAFLNSVPGKFFLLIRWQLLASVFALGIWSSVGI